MDRYSRNVVTYFTSERLGECHFIKVPHRQFICRFYTLLILIFSCLAIFALVVLNAEVDVFSRICPRAPNTRDLDIGRNTYRCIMVSAISGVSSNEAREIALKFALGNTWEIFRTSHPHLSLNHSEYPYIYSFVMLSEY